MSKKAESSAAITDTRIVGYTAMPPPAALVAALPNPHAAAIAQKREQIHRILVGEDDRLFVVVGPCSIHDPAAALDYAAKLKALADELGDELLLIMRVYFEKPRTTVGWKGLINDPGLDGTFDVRRGLELARKLLLDINALELACATEFLDTVIPQYIADCVAWGAIGARTTESQIHREMASGISCPLGLKNGTDGNVTIAVDALRSASSAHHFLAITTDGSCAIAETTGNPDTHVILRGGHAGPNYDAASIDAACAQLTAKGLAPRLMVDCSHANSAKKHRRQLEVAADLAGQVGGGEARICALMVESNLIEGRQDLGGDLTYGQSVTDACLGWDDTVALLGSLADAVRRRRAR